MKPFSSQLLAKPITTFFMACLITSGQRPVFAEVKLSTLFAEHMVFQRDHKQWHDTEAKIAGDQIIVYSPEVTKPVVGRYGWANALRCNLYNAKASASLAIA